MSVGLCMSVRSHTSNTTLLCMLDRHNKTVLSVSRPLWRCELDGRQLKTVADRKFEVWTRSEQSSNKQLTHQTRHRQDRLVVSGMAVWIWVGPTGRQVCSASECVGRRRHCRCYRRTHSDAERTRQNKTVAFACRPPPDRPHATTLYTNNSRRQF